jgi:hypothetical protein
MASYRLPMPLGRVRSARFKHWAGLFAAVAIGSVLTLTAASLLGAICVGSPAGSSGGGRLTAGALWRRQASLAPLPPPGMPHLGLVTLYSGTELPWYASYFAESCGAQRPGLLDCIIVLVLPPEGSGGGEEATGSSGGELALHPSPASVFTCRRPDDALPPNVLVYRISEAAFRALLLETTGLHLAGGGGRRGGGGSGGEEEARLSPRKMSDFKPLAGELLASLLPPSRYDAWGWADLDLVLGDVGAFLDAANRLAEAGRVPEVAAPGVAMWGWPDGGSAPLLLPWDVWTSSYEGQSSWPVLTGQFTLMRNTAAVNALWRSAPTEVSPATRGAWGAEEGPG